MKKLKPSHYLIGVFVLLVALLMGSNYRNNRQEKQLKENGIATIATITDIEVNNYKANELEGKFVENYVLTFEFSVDGKNIKSVRTVEKKEYKRFFNKSLSVNDKIDILYDPTNPKYNTLKELHLN